MSKSQKKMKGKLNITVDVEILQVAKIKGINISGVCNEFLRSYLEIEQREPSDIELMRKEVQESEAILGAMKVQLKIMEAKQPKETPLKDLQRSSWKVTK